VAFQANALRHTQGPHIYSGPSFRRCQPSIDPLWKSIRVSGPSIVDPGFKIEIASEGVL
jgi:hypothetical protein